MKSLIFGVHFLALISVFSQNVYNDLSFNTGTGFNGTVNRVHVLTNDKILIGGVFTSYNGATVNGLVKLNANGTIDNSFNIGSGFNASVDAISVQSDGKILVGGSFTSFNGFLRNGIVRLNANGSIDLSFNVGTGFSENIYFPQAAYFTIRSFCIQQDGKILVGGYFSAYNGTMKNSLVRLNPDGTVDASFNTGTGIMTQINPSSGAVSVGNVYCISVQSDGKIIVSGSIEYFNNIQVSDIIRLNSNGTIDNSFSPYIYLSLGITSFKILPNAKIIAAGGGINWTQGSPYKKAIQLNQVDGSIDSSFFLNVPSGSSGTSDLIVLPNGKFIFSSYPDGIMSLNSDGSVDNTYDIGGGFGANNGINALGIQSDGKIIAGGSFSTFNSSSVNNIIRLKQCAPYSDTVNTTASWCFPYVSPSGATYGPGSYFEVIDDISGCDSVYLNINVQLPIAPTEIMNVSSCSPYISPTNQSYSETGIYYEALFYNHPIYQDYCDSVILEINLTILNSDSAFSATICNGDTYTWNNQQYNQAGQYTQTFTNQFGCDSVVTFTLNVNNNDNVIILPNPAFGNAPLNVAFANQTPNLSNYNFTWYFGDGTSQQSNAPFLSHIYTQNGYADVTVVADNLTTGCSSSQTFNDMIFVIGGVTCTHTATINQTGPLTGCVGDSIMLSSNTDPSFTYQWNKNGIPVSGATSNSFYPTQSGSYTVTIYENNCPVTSAGISVTMNALPTVPNITSSGTIVPCSGGSMTLTAPSGMNSYLWNTGATTSSINVSQSGNYSVTVSNSAGCQNTSNLFAVNVSFMQPQQVCIVGMDSLTNENKIIWEKPLSSGIDSFYVYKETNVSNVYTKIGGTDYTDLAILLDVNSNPAVQSYRYKVSIVDTCGVETNLGDFHKTIHLTINQGIGGAWNLIWSHYEGLNFGSYNIYRGTDPTNISLLTTIQSNLNSYTDLTPPTGPLYYQIEVVNPLNCDPTKSMNYGVSRSNIVNNGLSGVQEIVNTNIVVYPNPTNSNTTLEVSSELVGKMYSILDFSGRIILHGKISSNQEHIDMQHVARGAYYLSIDKSSSVTKLIKQ
jgi:uncharacterized delta-60 repeat protein